MSGGAIEHPMDGSWRRVGIAMVISSLQRVIVETVTSDGRPNDTKLCPWKSNTSPGCLSSEPLTR
jgi:hypothetical protein